MLATLLFKPWLSLIVGKHAQAYVYFEDIIPELQLKDMNRENSKPFYLGIALGVLKHGSAGHEWYRDVDSRIFYLEDIPEAMSLLISSDRVKRKLLADIEYVHLEDGEELDPDQIEGYRQLISKIDPN